MRATTRHGGTVRIEPAHFAATVADFDVVVLDVHGVLLNRPLHDFLVELGERSCEGGDALLARWRRELRRPFWEGSIDEPTMWNALAPESDPTDLRRELESRFAPGPLLPAVLESDARIWLLSNHRADWLLPRLERFGLGGRFERTLVSDQIGAANARIAEKRAAANAEVEAARQAAMADVESAVTDVVSRASEIATGKSADGAAVQSAVQAAMGASTGASS